MADELNQLKVDLALIKKDVKQIEKFFDKVDESVNTMSEISKQLAVQHQVTQNFYDKIDFINNKIEDLDQIVDEHRKEDVERTRVLGQRLEQYRTSSRGDHERLANDNSEERIRRHKEIMNEIREMNEQLTSKLNKQGERISKLENWKYYTMGIAAILVFVVTKFDFASFFS